MITLASECLVFRMATGEGIPFSAEMLSEEMLGETVTQYDSEFVRHAAKAVFHYFKHELGRQTVTLGEFAGALEKALHGFKLADPLPLQTWPAPGVLETDLYRLARESGEGCELFFFPRLRKELRYHLRQSPKVLRFCGLRGCVKQLAGTRRWTPRCRSLEERIVTFLRECLCAEPQPADFSLVVE